MSFSMQAEFAVDLFLYLEEVWALKALFRGVLLCFYITSVLSCSSSNVFFGHFYYFHLLHL